MASFSVMPPTKTELILFRHIPTCSSPLRQPFAIPLPHIILLPESLHLRSPPQIPPPRANSGAICKRVARGWHHGLGLFDRLPAQVSLYSMFTSPPSTALGYPFPSPHAHFLRLRSSSFFLARGSCVAPMVKFYYSQRLPRQL